jgi:hypothetical protein
MGCAPVERSRSISGLSHSWRRARRWAIRSTVWLGAGALALLCARTARADDGDAPGCNRSQQRGDYYCFYPYVTSYTEIDPGYAFGEDPVGGRIYRPRVEAGLERLHRPAPKLSRPRVSYAQHVLDSAGDL